jgi:MFS family permease
MPPNRVAFYALFVLFAINTMNFFDRQVIGAVGEPIRKEFQLSDSALGFLGTVFTLLYAAVGLPLGRLADRAARTKILAVGVFVWSVLTATSGIARQYWELVLYRLGVGVGEATCAPAATSLIGDLVPASRRAIAMSIFMMGLPVGTALSYSVTGKIVELFDWRTAFYLAAAPGLICALAVLGIREPRRGATEHHDIGTRRRPGSPYGLVLSIPTMRWIIVSGALHNFNMYALGSFLMIFLLRVHAQTHATAGYIVAIVYGLCGIPGLLFGGWLGDRMLRRMPHGRMLVGAVSMALSIPLVFLALGQSQGQMMGVLLLMGLGCGLMYTYYSTVYSTIHDVIEPSLRGTAMALYFFAMYVLGASLGPYGTGALSDYFTRRAALAAGVDTGSLPALEPFRGEGLHQAMYVIPILNICLALVLFAAARTVAADRRRLQEWMRVETSPMAEPEGKEVAEVS